MAEEEIYITGVGVVSPIGIGRETFWRSLCEGRSGIRHLDLPDEPPLYPPIGGAVVDFDPKQYVRQRKSLKVMSRDIQLACAAAELAAADAKSTAGAFDPDRLGVVFGAGMIPCELEELVGTYRACMLDGKFDFRRWGTAAMSELFPLWMLKYLPNMPACHIGIALDARGPNNTITLGDMSGISAIAEAERTLQRKQADGIITGGVGVQLHPAAWVRNHIYPLSRRGDCPSAASRPFDALRDGQVVGEGAGALFLERAEHARARGIAPIARFCGAAAVFQPPRPNQPPQSDAIRRAITTLLKKTGLKSEEIGLVVAHGLSTILDDRLEAQAIRDVLGEAPVTAPKSYFGHLAAGAGALETVLAALAIQQRLAPPTLNYETPDPLCPVNVIHGRPMPLTRSIVLVLAHSSQGQAAALALSSI